MADQRSINNSAWRKLRAQVLREEDVCYICGRPVDKTLPGTAPMGPQVDHIVARSEGGAVFERSNLHLVHSRCNQRKKNKNLDAIRYDELNDQQHSRSW